MLTAGTLHIHGFEIVFYAQIDGLISDLYKQLSITIQQEFVYKVALGDQSLGSAHTGYGIAQCSSRDESDFFQCSLDA